MRCAVPSDRCYFECMTMSCVVALALSACTGPDDDRATDTPVVDTSVSTETGAPSIALAPTLGPIATLTSPDGGLLHSHATAAWGDGDRYLVAFAAGSEPNTQALSQLYTADAEPVGVVKQLNSTLANGDKPDVEWSAGRYVIAWTDTLGRVALASIGAGGEVQVPGVVLVDVSLRTDAVDLAVDASGGGAAIWTEFGGIGMGTDDGIIAYRSFDAALQPVGSRLVVDDASRKTSDASSAPDGGFTAVWAIDYDHPSVAGDFVYEVWGRQYRADGTAWTFRADDLDTAYPSRPAIAVRPDGRFAVTWRDKTEADGPGLGSGAYVRLFDADAVPLGPSLALGPDHDGDRVVVGWAGPAAVVAWQETDDAGVAGALLSVVDQTGAVLVDRLAITELGGDRDERPSIAVRETETGWDVLVVWEALTPAGAGLGIRARRVALDQVDPAAGD